MLAFTFLSPSVLWGLAAVGVPVLIHLLFRVRRKTVAFSSIDFILASSVRQQSRTRLKELLLLLLRALAIAALVCAFARPALEIEQATAAQAFGTTAIVIDDTLSMQQRFRGGTALDWARREALRRVEDLSPTASVVLVTVSRQAPAERLDPKTARGLLQSVQPTYLSRRLAPAVQEAADLLAASDSATQRLLVISDFQRSAVDGLQEVLDEVPAQAELELLALPREKRANVAVAELTTPNYLQSAMSAKVTAAAVEEPITKRLEITRLSGEQVFSTELRFTADGATIVEVPITGLARGSVVRATLAGADALPADNSRLFIHGVLEQLSIVCIEEEAPARPFDAVSRFVRIALCPEAPQTGDGFYYQIQTLGRPALDERALRRTSVVVLCDLAGLTVKQVHGLESHIQAGGGCIIFTGPRSEPALYNGRAWRNGTGFVPARMKEIQAVGDDADRFWFLTDLATTHLALKVFELPGITDPSVANFWGRTVLSEPQAPPTPENAGEPLPVERPSVLARFDDGLPALVAGRFGRGRVLLIASTADRVWNDMPLHKFFVPMMHSLVTWAADRRPRSFPMITAGEALKLDLPGRPVRETVALKAPNGTDLSLRVDAQSLRSEELPAPGLYNLSGAIEREEKRRDIEIPVAVNLDPRESALEQHVPRPPERLPEELTVAADTEPGRRRVQLAHWFFAVALLLLAVELFVGNRPGFS